ncbi:aldolase [Neolentinus lepideus HHB14362 ss-1]|uniref:Aldolase n=1 Tax=Neolentinus lepideus HHB14362 ss-1 TaxID=1314782 RepID=A0A165QRE7_9AGAM|nr:aldolase [Neolentinus lepideus HHB14362 ss-1]
MAFETIFSLLLPQVTIDVDSMDPNDAASWDGTYQFCDMTSNQAIVYNNVSRADRHNVLLEAIDLAKESRSSSDPEFVKDVTDLLNILLARDVYPYLKGRVHVQVAPSTAYSKEGTIQHAKKLVSLFEKHGIPNDRVCVKIPATPESLLACQQLECEGIRTLATCLFSVEQAVAASQASCLYVAPYFNELRVHFEPALWKKYSETALEHPMSSVISSIVKTFKAIGSKTLVMPASIVTAEEVLALTSLGPDHLTLSGGVLTQLRRPPQEADLSTLSSLASIGRAVPVQQDLLAGNGKLLAEALKADAEANRKLKDALELFAMMEDKTFELIKRELAA